MSHVWWWCGHVTCQGINQHIYIEHVLSFACVEIWLVLHEVFMNCYFLELLFHLSKYYYVNIWQSYEVIDARFHLKQKLCINREDMSLVVSFASHWCTACFKQKINISIENIVKDSYCFIDKYHFVYPCQIMSCLSWPNPVYPYSSKPYLKLSVYIYGFILWYPYAYVYCTPYNWHCLLESS